ncbi:MAG TPA: MASE4 domain-containing protein [Burkholderiales bacterium]|nr:MASE4 domain-containing protein [Burkholderiales bacterium]
MTEPEENSKFYLSMAPAGRGERRVALAAVLVSVALFLALAPFAKLPLAKVPAFIGAYQSLLVLLDLITAALLLGQYVALRLPGLLALACGYFFTAAMALFHALTFPGLIAPSGLLGAGPQSTAWLYMFWHAGFPLLAIVYTLLKGEPTPVRRDGAAWPILTGLAFACLAAAGLGELATGGQDLLPAIMQADGYTATMAGVVFSVWALSVAALAVLWRRRPHSLLDLWLMVTLCAWIIDIALSAMLNAGRFDLGFYAGRIYGLCASSFVLVVLLTEHAALYRKRAAVRRRVRGERVLTEDISR